MARSALAGVLLGAAPMPAAAQETPEPLIWVARENQANLADEGVESVQWNAGAPQSWIFTAGFVTEINGATRMAVWKYRADWPDLGTQLKVAQAFYPAFAPASPETHKATGITVDANGNVYVIGQSQRPGGTDMDIVVIKYDQDLVPLWTDVGFGPGARRYNFVNGNDIPTDVAVDTVVSDRAIVVVGTSWNGANDDIVSLALKTSDGLPTATAWPDIGFGVGVRRYNHGASDRSVEVGGVTTIIDLQTNEILILYAVVLGTSFDPVTQDDYAVIVYGNHLSDPIWVQRYDSGALGNDTATGLVVIFNRIVATGYAPHVDVPGSMAGGAGMMSGPGGPVNLDYTTVAFPYQLNPPAPSQLWMQQWDYQGADDFAADIALVTPTIPPYHGAVTGRVGSGSAFDVGTIVYNFDTGLVTFLHAFAATGSSDDRGAAVSAGAYNSLVVGGTTDAVTPGNSEILVLKYTRISDPLAYVWQFGWHSIYTGFGGHDECRDVGSWSRFDLLPTKIINVWFTGTSFKPGQGQDGATFRYKQWQPEP